METQLDVVGTATNARIQLMSLKRHKPDIVLLDIIMPQIDGLTVMQRIWRIMIVLILHLLLLVQLKEAVTEDAFNMELHIML